MTAPANHGNSSRNRADVSAARPVVLVRYRPGLVGQTARTACVLSHATTSIPPLDLEPAPVPGAVPADEQTGAAALPTAVADYRSWGWPVTVCRDQIRLSVQHDPIAVMIPAPLAAQVTRILIARRCPPAVLAHPDAPGHRVLLAGEPFGVALPWPPGVHRVTGTVLLPPSVTPRGPITWVHRPEPDSLRLCREIDLFGALHTALTDPASPSLSPESPRGSHD
ncbi:MAG: hypothetical protein ACRDSL_12760 [Pseudonocardiaceae bacterium]